MNTFKELLDTVMRVMFGHTTIDNANDWKEAHDKVSVSRAEVEKAIREAEESQ